MRACFNACEDSNGGCVVIVDNIDELLPLTDSSISSAPTSYETTTRAVDAPNTDALACSETHNNNSESRERSQGRHTNRAGST
jgi:hypothetical protein